jgi:hypothetical protein
MTLEEMKAKCEEFQRRQAEIRRQIMEVEMAKGKFDAEFTEFVSDFTGIKDGQLHLVDVILKATDLK